MAGLQEAKGLLEAFGDNAHVQNPPLTQVAHAWHAEPPRGWAGMRCWRGGRSRVSTRHGSSR